MSSRPKLVATVLEAVQEELENQSPFKVMRGNYRSSELGDCPRYLSYWQLGKKKERISPELELLFRDGHLHEQAVVDLLRRKFTVTNQQYTGLKKYTVNGV